jgi:hypothetical protein
MAQLTHFTAGGLVVAAILLLPGCTGDAPIVLPSPESSTAPVFATDEEALAAAEAAYGEYLAASSTISSKEGSTADGLRQFVTDDYFVEVKASVERFNNDGREQQGKPTFDSITLQQFADTYIEPVVVVVYLCVDVSATTFVDAKGNDQTPPDRALRVPLEVSFVGVERTKRLLIDSSEAWTGEDFCVA